MKLRIKFRKQGQMKFIGHLDLMRFFQKAIRRADIDVAYSGGFSPHQIMSFAAPLSVGLTSDGEYLDIEVNKEEPSAVLKDRLNQAMMTEGMEIVSVRRLPEDKTDAYGNRVKNKTAMAIVAAASYEVRFQPGRSPEDWATFAGRLEDFARSQSIMIVKTTKKSETNTDIRPLIYSLKADEETETIHMTLAAGSAANLKPELVLEAFFARENKPVSGMELFSALAINRVEIYAKDLEGGLVPLEALGEEIE